MAEKTKRRKDPTGKRVDLKVNSIRMTVDEFFSGKYRPPKPKEDPDDGITQRGTQ